MGMGFALMALTRTAVKGYRSLTSVLAEIISFSGCMRGISGEIWVELNKNSIIFYFVFLLVA